MNCSFDCEYCIKKFESKKSLSNHRRWHNILKYEKFQKSYINKLKNSNLNEKNGMWKEKKVGLVSLHTWIRRRKAKPALCEDCKKQSPYDLANISGEYKRDVNDFEWLCRKCHMTKDSRIKNLKHQGDSND